MNTINVGFKRIEKWVEQQRSLGNNVEWEGWSLKFLYPAEWASHDQRGARQGGQWGILTTVTPNSEGMWEIPVRSVVRASDKKSVRRH